jgi:hypothetical protein
MKKNSTTKALLNFSFCLFTFSDLFNVSENFSIQVQKTKVQIILSPTSMTATAAAPRYRAPKYKHLNRFF